MKKQDVNAIHYRQSVAILEKALLDIGSLYDVPDSFPYRETSEKFLYILFKPIVLSVRR